MEIKFISLLLFIEILLVTGCFKKEINERNHNLPEDQIGNLEITFHEFTDHNFQIYLNMERKVAGVEECKISAYNEKKININEASYFLSLVKGIYCGEITIREYHIRPFRTSEYSEVTMHFGSNQKNLEYNILNCELKSDLNKEYYECPELNLNEFDLFLKIKKTEKQIRNGRIVALVYLSSLSGILSTNPIIGLLPFASVGFDAKRNVLKADFQIKSRNGNK
ncbi:hypothetical protein CLV96_0710 [Leptospira meyeri]|uniref:Uncharacterized protein n=1 Tax=Leptospira meyeri TaxID=29508 RepID=A0A4R8MQV5_LEPME|nr:hypothetical protein [Leptospira meyeri]EKJ85525.1 hypothetical protein LEP1GSC017_3253 [Leptospira meyeri serovar Hardjo str. Went 5]TDY71739.1 hypothetical protein CLV96_0710 [Leptospira meyeri]